MLRQCTRLVRKAVYGVAGLAVAAVAVPAHAGMTTVLSTPDPSEQGQAQILSHFYGGLFAGNGNTLTNGSVTATRVDDLSDAAWTGNKLTLTPVASFARSEQSLGLMSNQTGGYEHLLSVNQFGYLNAGSANLDLAGSTCRFTLDNGATLLRTSSLASENLYGDQMVTYKITGLGGTPRYMLFWEDTPLKFSDHDFNDLVVEAAFSGRGGPMAVPLPPAALLGLSTLGGVGVFGYFRKRKWAGVA